MQLRSRQPKWPGGKEVKTTGDRTARRPHYQWFITQGKGLLQGKEGVLAAGRTEGFVYMLARGQDHPDQGVHAGGVDKSQSQAESDGAGGVKFFVCKINQTEVLRSSQLGCRPRVVGQIRWEALDEHSRARRNGRYLHGWRRCR